jgi:hypothetical protein
MGSKSLFLLHREVGLARRFDEFVGNLSVRHCILRRYYSTDALNQDPRGAHKPEANLAALAAWLQRDDWAQAVSN